MATNKRLIKSNDEGGVGASFNTVTYTGNGSTQSITGVGFQPDFTWIKPRSFADNHVLSDSVRGVNKSLASNTTSSENSLGITSFNSDGFSLPQWGNVTSNGNDFVAWNFKAGGAAVTNTDGTTTSQVSANPEAGFSIVSYTGNGVSGTTIGHGLNDAPSFMIVKERDGTSGWIIYSESLGNTKHLLFTTAAEQTGSAAWNNTSPTSSVLSLGSNTYTNQSGLSYIAYCFAEVAGFSKFGSYVGNGGTNGPTVTTDFEPAFVMIKRADNSGVWVMQDNKRQYDPITGNSSAYLSANSSDSEGSLSPARMKFSSTNFQIINTSSSSYNASGGTYIYMAFANQF